MRRPPGIAVVLLAAALFACATATAIAGTIPIDTFVDPLPPNPNLPQSGQRVLFIGPYCDAPACPPGYKSYVGIDPPRYLEAVQAGLTGVIAGAKRAVRLHNRGASGDVPGSWLPTSAAFESQPARLEARFRYPNDFWLEFDYSGPGPGLWNFDAASLGVTAIRFRLEVQGLPPWMVQWELGLDELEPYGGSFWRAGNWDAAYGGVMEISLLDLGNSGLRLTSLDEIYLNFSICPEFCGQDPTVQDCRIAISELVFVTDASTPSVSSSWGRLKSLYR